MKEQELKFAEFLSKNPETRCGVPYTTDGIQRDPFDNVAVVGTITVNGKETPMAWNLAGIAILGQTPSIYDLVIKGEIADLGK